MKYRHLIQSFWRFLLRNRLTIAVLGVMLISSWQVVMADSGREVVDTCSELSSTNCQVLAATDEVERRNFTPAERLEPTDYDHFVSYRIVFEGQLSSSTNTSEFINQVTQTLGDTRGWARAGYVFGRTQTAVQADFSLTLIQAELLDTIPGCSSQWSCRSGTNVYINEDRWNGATNAWNNAGGGLRDYRHMVVNHEVGHWLGHGHYNCSDSPSNKAPVMQQQSIDLQGCEFNSWPLQFEVDAV